MKKHILMGLWLFFYIMCMVLGYMVPAETQGTQRIALTVLSVAFFVPGFLLFWEGYRQQDKKLLRIVRYVSIVSLSLTLLVLLLNVFSALWSEKMGNFLYELLILVSVPMITIGNWLWSMFLWAFLLFATLLKPQK